MLEFIVLGQVPGTQIYLSFPEVAGLFSLFVIGMSLAFGKSRHVQLLHRRKQEEIVTSSI